MLAVAVLPPKVTRLIAMIQGEFLDWVLLLATIVMVKYIDQDKMARGKDGKRLVPGKCDIMAFWFTGALSHMITIEGIFFGQNMQNRTLNLIGSVSILFTFLFYFGWSYANTKRGVCCGAKTMLGFQLVEVEEETALVPRHTTIDVSAESIRQLQIAGDFLRKWREERKAGGSFVGAGDVEMALMGGAEDSSTGAADDSKSTGGAEDSKSDPAGETGGHHDKGFKEAGFKLLPPGQDIYVPPPIYCWCCKVARSSLGNDYMEKKTKEGTLAINNYEVFRMGMYVWDGRWYVWWLVAFILSVVNCTLFYVSPTWNSSGACPTGYAFGNHGPPQWLLDAIVRLQ